MTVGGKTVRVVSASKPGGRPRRSAAALSILSLLAALALLGPGAAQAQTFSVLHKFHGRSDGLNPNGVTLDAKGDLYGTAFAGGASNSGVAFRLDSAGKLTVLHSFMILSPKDGAFPAANLIKDAAGDLYGTTTFGGITRFMRGALFKLDKAGRITVLYGFCHGNGCPDGENPASTPVRDAAGNLYGTAMAGGDCSTVGGCGVVFRLGADGTYTVLRTFSGGADGATPAPGGGLVMDGQGNLYGTAYAGGDLNCSYLTFQGCGTVFKIDPTGHFTVLHAFTGPDGRAPAADLALDAGGNLYGATNGGGAPLKPCLQAGGCGVVFMVTPAGQESVLHSFCGSKSCDEGFLAQSGVAIGADGALYGTTNFGVHQTMWGTVFKLKAGKLTTLHNFTGGADGATPQGVPVLDKAGSIYGATFEGGALSQCQFGCGVLYKIAPPAP